MSTIRIEAEAMTLDGYRVESQPVASEGQLISLLGKEANETGTASWTFTGSEGYYQLVLGYFDEDDGVGQITVNHPSGKADFQLDRQLGGVAPDEDTKVRQTIVSELWVQPGDVFTIKGIEDEGEAARIDYLELISLDSSNIKHTFIDSAGKDTFDGGSEIDSVDYSQAERGIIADLKEGKVLKPIFGTTEQPKILPIGDSITAGEYPGDSFPGAYRVELWNQLVADNLEIDFVGSQYNDSSNFGDKEHEGHPGWTINQINTLVDDGLLDTYQPDLVLLSIGTNDILHNDDSSTLKTELSQLIDDILAEAPDADLLVASIPPLDPSVKSSKKVETVKAYNQLIVDLVAEKSQGGQQVTFVDTGGILSVEDLISDGIHPTASGYEQMGKSWYNAIVERDTLIDIENIKGTDFEDRLTGNSENNILTGGDGSDTLTGGGGADSFIYNNPNQGSDFIADFSIDDRFIISASGFEGGLVAGVDLSETEASTGVFVSSSAPTSLGNSANFLYENDTGILSYDRDGSGSAVASTIAVLPDLPELSSEQFTIVA